MADVREHSGRYEEPARAPAAHGAVVYGPDHMGHGRSAGEARRSGRRSRRSRGPWRPSPRAATSGNCRCCGCTAATTGPTWGKRLFAPSRRGHPRLQGAVAQRGRDRRGRTRRTAPYRQRRPPRRTTV
ncbi:MULTISPECIES: serine aminopeptidase domain-containing protein [unclassified Streptomyces]|uniref:serine aminopeptidase domain-containing protein n=1 Tax=unclassified Streptomyces TaxID=2593676 RepID=UPI0033D496B3